MAIINGTFDTNISGWSKSGNNTTIWEAGKAHVRSGSQWGASFEQFAYFYQTFTLDNNVLRFDIQAIISGDADYVCGDCISQPGELFPIADTNGWTIKDSLGNVIEHGYAGATLQTVSIDLSNYIGQNIKISFQAGASRGSGEYYDLLVDNVMTVPGILFNPICSDTTQYCNAILYIDGIYQGTAPYYIAPTIGTHSYTLYKAGYNKFDGTINVTSGMISGGYTVEPTLTPGGGIINPTFDTDLSGWNVSGAISFDNGRVRLNNGGTIFQIFAVTDNLLEFDWETVGWSSSDSGLGYQIYIDGVLKIDKRLPGNSGNPLYGTENVYLGNYIGRTAKVLFYEAYNWYGWVDNIRFAHTTGVYNGTFDQGLAGWDTFGNVGVEEWFSPTNGAVHAGGILEQTFIIGQCVLKFDWLTSDPTNGYQFYVDGLQIISKTLPEYSNGTETIDVSTYIGHTAKISFWCNGYILAVDNVVTSVDAYGISIISRPPGADIYLNDIHTGQTTGDTPVIVDAVSEGIHTITLKLANYPDYVEIVNVIRCTTSYVSGVFAGCIAFITNPPGTKICIGNVDTHEITPKTFCGYDIGSSLTYYLYLKNYRVETETITFASDKGILVDKTLTYETGSIQFNVAPNGAMIIIDGTDTGKVTPDMVDNVPIGYHSYEIRLDGYYSLTGSFRSIVDTTRQITGTLQQITGVTNGTFSTDLSGWITTTSNLSNGNVEWQGGSAHLYGHDGSGLIIYQDITVIEDSLVFDYNIGDIRYDCDAGWSVTVDPGTPEANTIASWCGRYGGRFEADVSLYKNKNVRLLFYLNCNREFSWGSDTWVDNVGHIPKPTRSATFDSYCSTLVECPTSSLSITKCYADLYLDNNYIGIDQITLDNLSIGAHSYLVRNQGYTSIDTNTQDVTGTVSFYQGIPTHIYIDNIYLPTAIVPEEGCISFESIPSGLHIYIDDVNTGKITPDTVCNLSLDSHSYELKLLHSSYKGTFILGPGFGEYVSVAMYGNIKFGSVPSGAEIILDDIDLGVQTPYITGPIPIGSHTYIISLANFQEFTCQIEVIKDQTSIINPELISQEGCIYIDSCPIGVNVNVDGTDYGITPLSVCGLTGHHEYTLGLIGYEDYTETFDMPVGKGINKRILLTMKIGAPFTGPTKTVCSPGISPYDGLPPYYPDDPVYTGKNAFSMGDGSTTIVDAQGYDLIQLHVAYHNYWVGSTDNPIGCTLYIYQSDTLGDCITIPPDSELISTLSGGGWGSTLYNSQILFNGPLNVSKRYIIMKASVYMCGYWNCWGDGSSSIWVMEAIPPTCISPETTTCGLYQLYATVSAVPDQITSGDTSQITIYTTDDTGTPIDGTTVNLSTTNGTLNPISGTTDVNGNFISTYTAPTVTDIQTFTITFTTSKSGYVDGSGSAQITVRTPANIVTTAITPSLTACTAPCDMTVDITWTNNGGITGTFTPVIVVNGTSTPSATIETLDPTQSVTKTFSLTGLIAGAYNICSDPNTFPCATVTVTSVTQSGFGGVGMILLGGLLIGFLIFKKCDYKTKEECEKNGCQWEKDRCTTKKRRYP